MYFRGHFGNSPSLRAPCLHYCMYFVHRRHARLYFVHAGHARHVYAPLRMLMPAIIHPFRSNLPENGDCLRLYILLKHRAPNRANFRMQRCTFAGISGNHLLCAPQACTFAGISCMQVMYARCVCEYLQSGPAHYEIDSDRRQSFHRSPKKPVEIID